MLVLYNCCWGCDTSLPAGSTCNGGLALLLHSYRPERDNLFKMDENLINNLKFAAISMFLYDIRHNSAVTMKIPL